MGLREDIKVENFGENKEEASPFVKEAMEVLRSGTVPLKSFEFLHGNGYRIGKFSDPKYAYKYEDLIEKLKKIEKEHPEANESDIIKMLLTDNSLDEDEKAILQLRLRKERETENAEKDEESSFVRITMEMLKGGTSPIKPVEILNGMGQRTGIKYENVNDALKYEDLLGKISKVESEHPGKSEEDILKFLLNAKSLDEDETAIVQSRLSNLSKKKEDEAR